MSSLADKMYQRCREDNGGTSPSRRPTSAKNPMTAARPAFLTCFLCGQGFGTSSLKIHQPQCYVKKLLQWEKGDPAIRGPKPVHPDERGITKVDLRPSSPGGKMSREQIDSFNDVQFNEFNDKSLVPCENCGRTFFPDRLQVHLRSCKPGAASKRVPKRTSLAASSASPTRSSPTPVTPVPEIRKSAPNFDRPTPSSGGGGSGGGATTAVKRNSLDERPLPKRVVNNLTPPPPPVADDDQPEMGDDIEMPFQGITTAAPPSPAAHAAAASDDDLPEATYTLNEDDPRCGASLPFSGDGDGEEPKSDSPIPTPRGGSQVVTTDTVKKVIVAAVDQEVEADEEVEEKDPYADDEVSIAGGNFAEDAPLPVRKPKMQVHRPMDLTKALANRPSIFSGGGAAAEQSLVGCQYCRRTFAPDRIEKHESVCTEKKTISIAKATPRRVAGGTSGGVSGSSVSGSTVGTSVPGSVRSSVTSLPLGSVKRGTDLGSSRPSGVTGSGYGTARTTSPRVSVGAQRATTPRAGGGSVGRVVVGGGAGGSSVPTTSARPVITTTVSRSLPTEGKSSSASRSPGRNDDHHSVAYPPASLAPTEAPASGSSTNRAKFCTECGAKISSTQKFCGECGNRVCDM